MTDPEGRYDADQTRHPRHRANDRRREMMRTMNAKYAGRCRDCGGGIESGERIRWSKQTGAIHADDEVCASYDTQRQEMAMEVGAEARMTGAYANPDFSLRDETEIAIGMARADHIRDTARYFGEAAAVAEEYAWELKDPDPYY